MSLIRPTERNVDDRLDASIAAPNSGQAAQFWPIIDLHFGIDDGDIYRAVRRGEAFHLMSKVAQ